MTENVTQGAHAATSTNVERRAEARCRLSSPAASRSKPKANSGGIKFGTAMVDASAMGVLIALGLIVLNMVGVLAWRSRTSLLLAIGLAASSAAVWLVWAQNEYRGLTSCPYDQNRGHPALVALALSCGSAVVVSGIRWRRDSRGWASALGLSAGVLAAITILVVAFLFGAGLRCED